MFFRYIAIDPRGARREGSVEAASAQAVRSQLKTVGLEPVIVREDYVSLFLSSLPFSAKQLNNSEVAEILSFLADFLSSGMDISMALENLENVVRTKKARLAIGDIRAQVMRGASLSEAMKRTRLFPDVIYAGVYAGEQSGETVKALQNLEEGVRQAIEFNYEVRKAVTYPAMIISLVFTVIGIYLVYVLPKVRGIIEMTGHTPAATKIIFTLMEVVTRFWWSFPLVLGGVFVGLKQLKARVGIERAEIIMRSLPFVGSILTGVSLTRVFSTLHLLVKAGMNLKDTISIVAASQSNLALKNALLKVREGIVGGKPVSAAFRLPLFPDTVSKMLEVGEKAGLLERYTQIITEFYKKKTARDLKKLTAAMEPLMLVLAAGFIVLLFFGFIMPIYQSIMSLSDMGVAQ